MNSFYASVEVAHDPSLKGKPVAIAGKAEDRRGIIVTSSYEARATGVKTTMPVWEGMKLCPNLIVLPPDFTKYRAASLAMFEILRSYTSLVEPVSIDEGYMDVSDYLNQNPLQLADEIQQRLLRELGLPCSIGVAPNKFLAKMASDMKKPLGITVLRKREIEMILWPMPLIEMHGVGKKTAEKLNKLGLTSIGDLARGNKDIIKAHLGIHGVKIYERANGIDDRPVDPDAVSEFKSIGNSTTLRQDTTSIEKINKVLKDLSEEVGRRLSRKRYLASNIQITIRYSDRKTVTRSRKLTNPIQKSEDILKAAIQLWKTYWNKQPVRLIGITAMDLVEREYAYKQLDLFSYKEDERKWEVQEAVQQIRKRFGDKAIVAGVETQPEIEERADKGTSFNKDFLR